MALLAMANNPWYVILQEGNSIKTQTQPPMSGGKWTPRFPIVVKVYTERQADEVLTYDPQIQEIIRETDPLQQVKMALLLPGSPRTLDTFVNAKEGNGYFPVVWGQQCGIFLTHHAMSAAIHTTSKPIFHYTYTWQLAIAFMISKGETEKTNRNSFACLADAHKARLRRVQDPPAPPARDPPAPLARDPPAPLARDPPAPPAQDPSTPPQASGSSTLSRTHQSGRAPPEEGSRNERAAARFVSQPTPSLPSNSDETRDPANTPVTPSHADRPRRPPGQHLSVDDRATPASSSRPTPSMRGNEQVEPRDFFDHPAFKKPIFPAQTPYVADQSVVYQNVRSLHGVVRSSVLPVIETTPVASCGPAVDRYLQAMGYDVHAKLAINRALREAYELVDFVRKIVPQGIPVLEAKYMWVLYKSELPVTRWAELHIM